MANYKNNNNLPKRTIGMIRYIMGEELAYRVRLAKQKEEYLTCVICGHKVCIFCETSCDILVPDENGNNTIPCSCMNQKGCKVRYED